MKVKTVRGTNQYSQKVRVISGAKYCSKCGMLNIPTYSKGDFPMPKYDKCSNCGENL